MICIILNTEKVYKLHPDELYIRYFIINGETATIGQTTILYDLQKLIREAGLVWNFPDCLSPPSPIFLETHNSTCFPDWGHEFGGLWNPLTTSLPYLEKSHILVGPSIPQTRSLI